MRGQRSRLLWPHKLRLLAFWKQYLRKAFKGFCSNLSQICTKTQSKVKNCDLTVNNNVQQKPIWSYSYRSGKRLLAIFPMVWWAGGGMQLVVIPFFLFNFLHDEQLIVSIIKAYFSSGLFLNIPVHLKWNTTIRFQLFHYTLVKSHKYTNSAEGNGNGIKTDTG